MAGGQCQRIERNRLVHARQRQGHTSVLVRFQREFQRRGVVAVAVVNGVLHPLRILQHGRAHFVVQRVGHKEAEFVFVDQRIDRACDNRRALHIQYLLCALAGNVRRQTGRFRFGKSLRQICIQLFLILSDFFRRPVGGNQHIALIGAVGGPVLRQGQRPCLAERNRPVDVKLALGRGVLVIDRVVRQHDVVQRLFRDSRRGKIDLPCRASGARRPSYSSRCTRSLSTYPSGNASGSVQTVPFLVVSVQTPSFTVTVSPAALTKVRSLSAEVVTVLSVLSASAQTRSRYFSYDSRSRAFS